MGRVKTLGGTRQVDIRLLPAVIEGIDLKAKEEGTSRQIVVSRELSSLVTRWNKERTNKRVIVEQIPPVPKQTIIPPKLKIGDVIHRTDRPLLEFKVKGETETRWELEPFNEWAIKAYQQVNVQPAIFKSDARWEVMSNFGNEVKQENDMP